MRALLDEGAAGVDVIGPESGFDGRDVEAVGDEFVGVEGDLVLAGGAAEAGDVDNAGDCFELLLEGPVFNGFEGHRVVAGIGAFEGVPVDLADGAPVGADLRLEVVGQGDLGGALEDFFAVPVVAARVVKGELDGGDTGEGEGTERGGVGYAGYGAFEWNGDLLFDLLGGTSGPLDDDGDVVVGDVGVGLDGEVVEGDDAPAEEQDADGEDDESVVEREVDELSDHAGSLLLRRFFELKGLRGDLLACGEAARDDNTVTWNIVPGVHGDAAEGAGGSGGHEDPVLVMEVQDGIRRDDDCGLRLQAVEGGGGEEADAEAIALVGNGDPDLGGPDRGIEDGADVGDSAFDCLARVGVEGDVGFFAEMDLGEVVFVDIADDPDVGEVSDDERTVGTGGGETGGTGSRGVQGGDDARDGRVDMDGITGVVLIDAEDDELLIGHLQIGHGIVFPVLSRLELGLRDGSLVVKELVADEGDVGEMLVVDGLDVGIEGGRDIGGLDVHDQLALVDVIADIHFQGGDAAIGDGEDRDLVGGVGLNLAGDVEAGEGGAFGGGDEGELLRILYLDLRGLADGDDRRRGGWGLRGFAVGRVLGATAGKGQCAGEDER